MQWIAYPDSLNSSTGILDLDRIDDVYAGIFVILTPGFPLQFCYLKTLNTGNEHRIDVEMQFAHPGTAAPIPRETLKEMNLDDYDGRATLALEMRKQALKFSWSRANGDGSMLVPNSRAASKSEYRGPRAVRSWTKFKTFCDDLPKGRYIFRGQGRDWRLRTAFHRTGRSVLPRYLNVDLPSVRRALSGRTKHLFDVSIAEQNGAFLNLIQHHGFPTPLLDWSESPFIAAYFAYQDRRRADDPEGPVRILCFDRRSWMDDFQQMQHLALVGPHVSVLEALEIENNRASPQQALSTVTNIDDIEGYIRLREKENGKQYLRVFDLPYASRSTVLGDLSMMGITAGSIFPGLDGTCQALKAKFFGFDA